MDFCPHLDADELSAFLAGRLEAAALARLERHVADCRECRELLSELARHQSVLPPTSTTLISSDPGAFAPFVHTVEEAVLPAGSAVGRYVVLRRLGAGGMGVVYAARDPELNRNVALKVLRSELVGADERAALRDRLLREARAMALLKHPNVVAVHDVGSFGDQIFIAMELVEGQTLAQWVAVERRPVGDTLDAFLPAGHGLAAAHEAGLVHRDFKPENVLVGSDGRVRVTDFGLARALSAAVEPGGAGDRGEIGVGTTLTVTGALMGTPFYMSPEQFLATAVDARTDQFSFCVALYVALAGEHPFVATGAGGLADAVIHGRLRRPSRHDRVPGWLRPLLVRGLATAPEARHPSMRALLAAIERGRARRKRRTLALAAVGVLLAGAVGYRQLRAPAAPCRDAGQPLAGVWDGARAGRLRAHFAASGLPWAGAAADQVRRVVDGYTQAWAAMRTEACEATAVRGDQSQALFELRQDCLDARLDEVRALLGQLEGGDPARVVERAPAAVRGLGELAGCADAEALLAPARPLATARAPARTLRAGLAEVAARDALGEAAAARPRARELAAAAAALRQRPLEAEALQLLGRVEAHAGDAAAARAALERAVWAAEAGRDDERAARVWLALMETGVADAARAEEALALAPRVTALLERLGSGHEALAGALHVAVGRLQLALGRTAAAVSELGEGVALLERHLAADDLRLLAATEALGRAREAVQPGAGREALARALAITRKVYGDESHPEVARAREALSAVDHARASNEHTE